MSKYDHKNLNNELIYVFVKDLSEIKLTTWPYCADSAYSNACTSEWSNQCNPIQNPSTIFFGSWLDWLQSWSTLHLPIAWNSYEIHALDWVNISYYALHFLHPIWYIQPLCWWSNWRQVKIEAQLVNILFFLFDQVIEGFFSFHSLILLLPGMWFFIQLKRSWRQTRKMFPKLRYI